MLRHEKFSSITRKGSTLEAVRHHITHCVERPDLWRIPYGNEPSTRRENAGHEGHDNAPSTYASNPGHRSRVFRYSARSRSHHGSRHPIVRGNRQERNPPALTGGRRQGTEPVGTTEMPAIFRRFVWKPQPPNRFVRAPNPLSLPPRFPQKRNNE